MNLCSRLLFLCACLLFLAGATWLWITTNRSVPSPAAPQFVNQLTSGVVARMDSPPFEYSSSWQVNDLGADPAEPADAFVTPSGRVSFTYQGDELALQLAVGNYWGYLYATVDGQPANLLPSIAGNRNSLAQPAGYKPLYEPEKQTDIGPSPRWVRIHRASQPGEIHEVHIEVWRSWGQTPIRAVAVDALPGESLPSWPGVALMVLAVAAGVWGVRVWGRQGEGGTREHRPETRDRRLESTTRNSQFAIIFSVLALLCITSGVLLNLWWLCLGGVSLLALVGMVRPIWWLAALLFALPFYFSTNLPLLPGRTIGIIDLGVFGGAAILLVHLLLSSFQSPISNLLIPQSQKHEINRLGDWRLFILWFIIGWALVATSAAEQFDIALREWRTVFLAAGIFAWLLRVTIRNSQFAIRNILLPAWSAGATTIALIGLAAYVTGYDQLLVGAEGVTRLRSLYGSPNNLAAYLERTLALSLALALFADNRRTQILFGALALPQAAALLLTFSKGGLFLGLPAMIVVLAIGGTMLLRQQGRSLRPLWGLVVVSVVAAVMLVPVFGTDRFRGLLDFSSNTSLFRLSLWRSAWQMALDHPWLGVGPDNFLYAFRSGYLLPAAWQEPDLNHPHNFVLDWWTRLGVLGLGLGLAWWGSSAWQMWGGVVGRSGRLEIGDQRSEARDQSSQLAPISLGLLAAMAAGVAHGLIDVSYALPDLILVWVLITQFGGLQNRD